jgi:nucleotide-binding universal stress UspA family protein
MIHTAVDFRRIVVAAHAPGHDPHLEHIARMLQPCGEEDGCVIHSVYIAGSDLGPRETLDTLVSEASSLEADLLVMGARSHLLASRAAMVSPCSLLMAPDTSKEFQLDRILIPVDFSSQSEEALQAGAALAERSGGEAICVFIENEEAPWHARRDETVDHIEKLKGLEAFVRRALGPGYAVRCLSEPLEGGADVERIAGFSLPHAIEGADVADTIERVAAREQADLIVMGTRGRSRSTAVLLGSVTEKVMRYAQRPILAVKRRGSNLGLMELLFGSAGVVA